MMVILLSSSAPGVVSLSLSLPVFFLVKSRRSPEKGQRNWGRVRNTKKVRERKAGRDAHHVLERRLKDIEATILY